jgi:serine/threonine-protein kinase
MNPSAIQSRMMPSRRAPWWMYLVAACFMAMFVLFLYLMVRAPSDLGDFSFVVIDGEIRVQTISPNSQPDLAGLRIGDRIIRVDGHPVRSGRDWGVMDSNRQVGVPQIWEVSRGDKQFAITITSTPPTLQSRLGPSYLFYMLLVISCFLVGQFIAFSRPYDVASRIGGWLMLTVSMVFGLPSGWAAVWRQLPELVQGVLWLPEISRFVFEGIFLSFFSVFPRRLFRTRWPWFAIWIPVLITVPWRISGFYSTIHLPVQTGDAPLWVSAVVFGRTILYLLGGCVMLAVSYWRLADLNERRRVRVLTAGLLISLLSGVAISLSFSSLASSFWISALHLDILALLFMLACPVTFAYAILRHRVLDIEVIIRQGLQYTFARRALLALVPVLSAIVVLDFGINRQQPLSEILRNRGWVYAAIGTFGLVAYRKREQWLETLDRRFFRERYNAQRLLRDVVEWIRTASSFEQVSTRVVDQIEAAVHPEFAALMTLDTSSTAYSTLASAPRSANGPPPLAAGSKLIGLLRLLGKPLEVFHVDSSWLSQGLPQEEVDLVRRAKIDMLVPVVAGSEIMPALLVLGTKRSEEPYTREDQELFEAITSSLALLHRNPTSRVGKNAGSFEECSVCGKCYEPGSTLCKSDGTPLQTVRLPRTLAGRYRLDRRRGAGGMGTVYEAIDRELDRPVAVKVLREVMVGSDDAAQRFRRESRITAAFAHPNVVTVHDFGVESGTRAFLVMELLEGATLRDELNRLGRLAPDRVAEIFRGVCAAVDAAHQRQLIHRDLKPENIFLVRAGDGKSEIVKVLDFGIAKLLPAFDDSTPTRITAETGSGILVGTLAYMSPEQLIENRPELSWDLWALSVVAYEAVTGAMPFPSGSARDWRQAILKGAFIPMTNHIPDAPRSWQAFFAACFSTDKSRRPRSSAEFLQRLEETLR